MTWLESCVDADTARVCQHVVLVTEDPEWRETQRRARAERVLLHRRGRGCERVCEGKGGYRTSVRRGYRTSVLLHTLMKVQGWRQPCCMLYTYRILQPRSMALCPCGLSLPPLRLQNAMTSSEERTSAEAEGYRIERALMDCVAPPSSRGGDAIHQCPRADSRLLRGGGCLFRPAAVQQGLHARSAGY